MLVYTITKAFKKVRRPFFRFPASMLCVLPLQAPNQHILESNDFTVERTKPLIWRTMEEHVLPPPHESDNLRTNTPHTVCRNSIQGKTHLVDDRGFMCIREHILRNGCCNIQIPSTKYYTCDTCNATSHCCGIYENCVSCCLHPDKRPILELALEVIKGRQAMVYAQVADQFELCLVKCRTNSHSVMHENRYRDVKFRFCYGPTEAHESQKEVSGMGS